jgi:hypothetical protein
VVAMKKHAAPIIASILLLLLVLYVGSYFALVVPGGTSAIYAVQDPLRPHINSESYATHYRRGHRISERLFWPLEQIDRKVRGAWRPEPIVY